MQVIRQVSDVAHVADLVIRGFLAKRISHMVMDWAPDLWPDFGQLLVLESGDDPAIVEAAGCLRLVGSPLEWRVWESPDSLLSGIGSMTMAASTKWS